MEIEDDRKGTQQSRLSVLIGGKDSFMSGWGRASRGGISYAYWACSPEDAETVERWVRSRGDIDVSCRDEPPQGRRGDHCHIYCVESTHPALQGG